MSTQDPDYDLTESDQDVTGEMGVSSQREGHTGPGQHAPTGTRDTSEPARPPARGRDAPREQSAGGEETNPEGLTPKAGYSSTDPRSDD